MEKKAKKEEGFVFPEPKRKKARKNLTLDLKPKETSEHVEFDVDAFLDSIPRPPPQCPRCLNDLTMGSIKHEDGSQWEYYRCPTTRFDTNCYAFGNLCESCGGTNPSSVCPDSPGEIQMSMRHVDDLNHVKIREEPWTPVFKMSQEEM